MSGNMTRKCNISDPVAGVFGIRGTCEVDIAVTDTFTWFKVDFSCLNQGHAGLVCFDSFILCCEPIV